MTSPKPPSPRPSLAGYALAILSVPALIVASGFTVSWAFDLQRKAALDEMRDALDRSALTTAKILEERLIEKPEGLLLAASAVGEPITGLKGRPAEELEALYRMIEPLAEEPFTKDSFERASNGFGSYHALIDRRDPVLERIKTEKKISVHLGEIKVLLDRSLDFTAKIAALTEEQGQLVRRHSLVGKDFAEFFALRSAYEEEGETFSILKVYTEGVLKGLPQITDLPDGIETLSILKNVLEKLRAKVRATGPEAGRIFNEKLAELRAASSDIESVYRANEEKIATLDGERQQSLSSLKASRSLVRGITTSLMHDLLHPS